MSAKRERFSYLKTQNVEAATADEGAAQQPTAAALRTVPRGQGRMEQEREQLNVRLPTMLKRQALAKAALEGKTIGDVVEQLLYEYVNASNTAD